MRQTVSQARRSTSTRRPSPARKPPLLAAAAAKGRTEIRHVAHGAARRRALPVPSGDGRVHRGEGTRRRSGSRRPARCKGATHRLRATTSRPEAGASSRPSPEATSMSRGARRATWRSWRRLSQDGAALQLRGRSADRRVVGADGGRRITTGLWPGFPSDMVSLVTVLATQADGRTLVHDWLYELRLFALEQLSAMRADLFLCDPHRIIVSGPTKLRGRLLDARDLRSGMALHCSRTGGRRREHGDAARDRRAWLCVARRAAYFAGRDGRTAGLNEDKGEERNGSHSLPSAVPVHVRRHSPGSTGTWRHANPRVCVRSHGFGKAVQENRHAVDFLRKAIHGPLTAPAGLHLRLGRPHDPIARLACIVPHRDVRSCRHNPANQKKRRRRADGAAMTMGGCIEDGDYEKHPAS